MLSRERVIATIEHRPADRIPIYGWVRANLSEVISAKFGSVDAFEDHYEFDFAHLFGGPDAHPHEALRAVRAARGELLPADVLALPQNEVNNSDAYDGVRAQVRHHKERRGRFVYMQTPGIFECLNGVFGIEDHLAYLALYPEELAQVYARQAAWNRAFAMNCLDCGVDMIHVSDDWGAQTGLMFSPRLWWELIYPNHKLVVDAVKARGAYASVHTDGNVLPVLDGIVKLGYDVVHPWQESAGMPLTLHREKHLRDFTVMGGLDVQTTIGFGKPDLLRAEIERVMTMYRDGGLLFCTTHFVQEHCSLDELCLAFDVATDLARRLGRG